jgi:hypothetical protein
MNRIFILVILLLSSLTTSCVSSQDVSRRDLEWLQKQQTCSPCWESILVGRTTVADALTSLRAMTDDIVLSGDISKKGFGQIRWNWKEYKDYEPARWWHEITVTRGISSIVESMSFSFVDGLPNKLIIEKLGNPTAMYVRSSELPVGIGHGEPSVIRTRTLILIYEDRGLMFWSRVEGEDVRTPISELRSYNAKGFWPRNAYGIAMLGISSSNIVNWGKDSDFYTLCQNMGYLRQEC